MSAQPKFTRVRQLAENGIGQGLHLGGQLYVSQHGETLLDVAVGEAQPGVPMEPDSLMVWLSAGKPIAALAIAQLCARGAVSLDAPVSQEIPEFGVNDKETVTVRHLLTHTGGIRTADKCDLGTEWISILKCVCDTPAEANSSPGAQAAYHVSGSWYVLGEIVQRVDGRPFDQYARETIFAPSGSRDCSFQLSPEQLRAYGTRLSVLYHTETTPPIPHRRWNSEKDAAVCRPGRSARGPIRELGRIYEELRRAREGDRSAAAKMGLTPEWVQQFTSRQREGMFDDTFQHTVDWGFGFYINSNRYGRESVPYGYGRYCADETFGHSGAQSSCAFADPTHALVVAWAFNGMPGERVHQQRARELNSAIYLDLGLSQVKAPPGQYGVYNQALT